MARVASVGVVAASLFLIITVGATVLGPVLLPWLPGRAFSAKGLWLGCAMLLAIPLIWAVSPDGVLRTLDLVAWAVAVPATASFVTMNFTGATPFTSLSGVQREVQKFLPLQIIGAAAALVLWAVARFV